MSSSIIANLFSLGKLDIGKDESLNEEELEHLNSSSKTELEAKPVFLDLNCHSRDMPRPRGNPIAPSPWAPESYHRAESYRGGSWSTNNFDDPPSTSRPSSSSGFQAVNHSNPGNRGSSFTENGASKSFHKGVPRTAYHRLFNDARKTISSGDRSNSAQAFNSKQSHKIKGAAAKAVLNSVEGKGKAKAKTPAESAHIDLTGDCEEGKQEPDEIINEMVGELVPTRESSEDPLLLSGSTKTNKRIDAMQGKDNHKMNKSNPRPPLNTNGKNSKINQVGSPRVELSRITFCDGQIDFSQSGRSGYVTIIPDNQELYFELLAPKPAHGKFKMRSIKALYLSDDEQCPSQLVLEFNESYKATTKTAFRYFTSLFRKLLPMDRDFNACRLEVLDDSFNPALAELADEISRSERAPKLVRGNLEETCKFCFPQPAPSDADDPESDDEPELFSSRFPPTHSPNQLSFSPPSPSQSPIDKTSWDAIENLSVSTSVYRKSNPTPALGLKSENKRIADIQVQTTVNSSENRKPSTLTFQQQLAARSQCPAGKAAPKKIDPRQDLLAGKVTTSYNQKKPDIRQDPQDGQTSHNQKKTDTKQDPQDGQTSYNQKKPDTRQASHDGQTSYNQKKIDTRQDPPDGQGTARYNTRNSQSRSSIQPPIDTPSQPPLGSYIDGPDGDIALIWPFDGDRNSRSVAITYGDLKRLADGEFLNDTLIEFGLEWELCEMRKRDPELVASIHLFNSFFFQKLSGCKSKEKTAAGEAEAYAGVRKWTKGIDIFKKDFLVIPINEHMHWYFMIISNPGKLLDPRIHMPETNSHALSTPMRTRLTQKPGNSVTKQSSPTTPEPQDNLKKSHFFASPDTTSKPNFTLAQQAIAADEVLTNDLSTNVNAAVDNSAQALQDMDLDDENSFAHDFVPNAESSTLGTTVGIDLPYVLTLDSLGTPHRPQSGTLLRYLINEAKDKLGETLPESLAKSVSIKKVAVPEQPNFCDCGLYLIHAFKTFFSKPKRMMRWILDYNSKKGMKEQRQSEICETWNATGAAQARQALREQLQKLIPEYQEVLRLRKASTEAKKEQARVRKLSCTDEPRDFNHDSAKKQRLSCSEPNDQAPSVPSSNRISCTANLARSQFSRFFEGSSKTMAEIEDVPDTRTSLTPKAVKTTTSSPSPDQSIDPVVDQLGAVDDHLPDAVVAKYDTTPDPSPEAILINDDRMDLEDNRSATPDVPDEDLMLQAISGHGPHTPDRSPTQDRRTGELLTDVRSESPVGKEENVYADISEFPEATTPPEEDSNYDGEALPPEMGHSSSDSSLTEFDSSVHASSSPPGPTAKAESRKDEREGNPMAGRVGGQRRNTQKRRKKAANKNKNKNSSRNSNNRHTNNSRNGNSHNHNQRNNTHSSKSPIENHNSNSDLNLNSNSNPNLNSYNEHNHLSNHSPPSADIRRNQNGGDSNHPVMVDDD